MKLLAFTALSLAAPLLIAPAIAPRTGAGRFGGGPRAFEIGAWLLRYLPELQESSAVTGKWSEG